MFEKTNAIVIKSLKFGDSSLIVNCYCENFGLQTFILKGILKSKKSKSPKKSLFEPLSIIEIIFSKKKGNNMGYIKEAKLKFPYMDIPFKSIELDIMRGVKKVFDPKNILNPGKIF